MVGGEMHAARPAAALERGDHRVGPVEHENLARSFVRDEGEAGAGGCERARPRRQDGRAGGDRDAERDGAGEPRPWPGSTRAVGFGQCWRHRRREDGSSVRTRIGEKALGRTPIVSAVLCLALAGGPMPAARAAGGTSTCEALARPVRGATRPARGAPGQCRPVRGGRQRMRRAGGPSDRDRCLGRGRATGPAAPP